MSNLHQPAASDEAVTTSSGRRIFSIVAGCLLLMTTLAVLLGLLFYPAGTTPGTRLLYRVDEPASAADVVEPLRQRLRVVPGIRVEVQEADERHVEVLLTSRDHMTVQYVRQLTESAGVLRFLIVANPVDHASLIDRATEQAELDRPDAESRDVTDEAGSIIGRWVTVSRVNEDEKGPLRVDVSRSTVRNADTGEIVAPPKTFGEQDAKIGIAQWMDDEGIAELDVLMAVDPDLEVDGTDLDYAAASLDAQGDPALSFGVTDEGAARFLALTTANAPVGSRVRQLGIVLDDVLLTAPVIRSPISDSGQISGNFTREEIDLMLAILRAGQLPVKVHRVPGSEAPVEMPKKFSDMFR